MTSVGGAAEFVLAIHRQSDGSYRSLVLEGAVGTHSSSAFKPPFCAEETKAILSALARPHSQGIFSGVAEGMGIEPMREVGRKKAGEARDLKAVGMVLYDALFQGDVGESFNRSLERARGAGKRRTQLRLVFGVGDRSPDYLAALPWDLLHDPRAHDFMVLGNEISLARQFRVPEAAEPDFAERPLRILGVMAQPTGVKPLRLFQEWEAIQSTVKNCSRVVEVELFERESIEELRDRLDRGKFDCLHFMGHGDLEGDKGSGELFFVTDQGSPRPISGSLLATNLRDLPKLHLVVLNACNGAALAFGEGVDPFLGVASSLLREGIHAVVGMQTSISDRSARQFSTGFFRALGRGCPLETALFEGRLEILNRGRKGSGSWAIPTLFKARTRRDDVSSGVAVSIPELPRRKAERLLEMGLQRLRSGDDASAQNLVRKAVDEDPGFDLPRLHLCLLAMTNRSLALMENQEADDVSRSLTGLARSEIKEVRALANILLYLVNQEFYSQKGIKPIAPSAALGKILQDRRFLSREHIDNLARIKKSMRTTLLLELPLMS